MEENVEIQNSPLPRIVKELSQAHRMGASGIKEAASDCAEINASCSTKTTFYFCLAKTKPERALGGSILGQQDSGLCLCRERLTASFPLEVVPPAGT